MFHRFSRVAVSMFFSLLKWYNIIYYVYKKPTLDKQIRFNSIPCVNNSFPLFTRFFFYSRNRIIYESEQDFVKWIPVREWYFRFNFVFFLYFHGVNVHQKIIFIFPLSRWMLIYLIFEWKTDWIKDKLNVK